MDSMSIWINAASSDSSRTSYHALVVSTKLTEKTEDGQDHGLDLKTGMRLIPRP